MPQQNSEVILKIYFLIPTSLNENVGKTSQSENADIQNPSSDVWWSDGSDGPMMLIGSDKDDNELLCVSWC